MDCFNCRNIVTIKNDIAKYPVHSSIAICDDIKSGFATSLVAQYYSKYVYTHVHISIGDTPLLTVKQTLISIYKQLSIFSIDERTFPI